MFTVKNTLAGAIVMLVGLFVQMFVRYESPGFDAGRGPMAAWFGVLHVWFLIGHLRLKDRAKASATN
jgi:hypothetical protein